MVYRRRGRPTYYLKLPTRTGWVQRSTGTSDRATAKAIERMLIDWARRGNGPGTSWTMQPRTA